MKFLIRWLIAAVALYVAFKVVPGIEPQSESWVSLVWLALIFGLLNALVRPVLKLLTCPFIILTLGLGILLINTLMFVLAGWIGTRFGVGFTVDGFWTAFLGALVASVVSFFLNLLLKDENSTQAPKS